MKTKLLYLSGFLILAGIALNGIFGIAGALFLSGIIGTIMGIYKKDKSIWRPAAAILTVVIVCIVTFIILLNNSNM